MSRSGKGSMEYRCLNRFRRRRLLALVRRNNLPATFDALKHETRVFFDLRFLQRLVVEGRWQEAGGYVGRFLPCRNDQRLVDAHPALRLITHLHVLDDLAQGKLGVDDAAEDLTMTDPHYYEAVRTVISKPSHRAFCDPVDWQLIRLKASQIVNDLILKTPEFRHLIRMPQCPINQGYTIPFRFGGRQRHQKKSIGKTSAFHLTRCFLRKKRRPPPPWTQGSSSEQMDLDELIDESLLAGKQEAREYSDSCSEGIPGSPVGSFMGQSCGISSADAVSKCLSQEEYSAESTSDAKLPCSAGEATEEFYMDAANVPSGWIGPMHVLQKMGAMGKICSAMATLLRNRCIGPEHNMFVEKLLEQEKLLCELRVDCIKAKGSTSTEM